MKKITGGFIYVIQKHGSVRPHFDLRLEIGGVLSSWSVPKGPTLDPAVKRFAMKTEDHDMPYRNFEGVIPEGQYGAGTVLIWDEGTFAAEREISKGNREEVSDKKEAATIMSDGLKKGEIKFFLNGKKLKGSFALVKTHGFGPKNAWLLIKHKDTFCRDGFDANTDLISARSGKKISDVQSKGED